MIKASEGYHSVSETQKELRQRVAKVRLACIGLDLKDGKERRKVAGATDDSRFGWYLRQGLREEQLVAGSDRPFP